MSEEDLQLARDSYEAWNRGDTDWFAEHLADDADIAPIRGYEGLEQAYRGPEGWKKFWRLWRRKWQSIDIRVERMEDLGGRGVLVLLTFKGVAKTDGDVVSMTASHWLTFRDGRLAGIRALAPETAERRREART
jgi:ketosteroid isomerase-like protein